MPSVESLLEVIRCPESGGILRWVDDGSERGALLCDDSNLLYPIGPANIPALLAEEAKQLAPEEAAALPSKSSD